MYSGINYVLMCASVLVIGGLAGGLLFLFLREQGLIRLKRQQSILNKLKRRRPAFSGQSGGSPGSMTVDSHMSPSLTHHLYHTSPLHKGGDEGEVEEEEEERDFTDHHHPSANNGIYVVRTDVRTMTSPPRHGEGRRYHDNGNVTSQPTGVTHVRCNGVATTSPSPALIHMESDDNGMTSDSDMTALAAR